MFKSNIVFVILALCCSKVFGSIIYVPQNQPTIQQAIDVAQSGDTVLVDSGIYQENIKLPYIPR